MAEVCGQRILWSLKAPVRQRFDRQAVTIDDELTMSASIAFLLDERSCIASEEKLHACAPLA
jgi:hypothetical protein